MYVQGWGTLPVFWVLSFWGGSWLDFGSRASPQVTVSCCMLVATPAPARALSDLQQLGHVSFDPLTYPQARSSRMSPSSMPQHPHQQHRTKLLSRWRGPGNKFVRVPGVSSLLSLFAIPSIYGAHVPCDGLTLFFESAFASSLSPWFPYRSYYTENPSF